MTGVELGAEETGCAPAGRKLTFPSIPIVIGCDMKVVGFGTVLPTEVRTGGAVAVGLMNWCSVCGGWEGGGGMALVSCFSAVVALIPLVVMYWDDCE